MPGLLDLLMGGQQQSAQAPQAAPRQGGRMGDFLSALGPAIAMLDPRNQQLGMGLMAMNSDRRKQAQNQQNQNVTAAWLQKNGVGAEEASFLASNHDALNAWYKDFKTGNQPDWQFQTVYDDQGREQKAIVDMKTGKFNIVGGPKGGPDGSGDEYGLNPQYGVDEQGNPVLVQVGKSGTAVKTKMPDGVTLSKTPIKMDAGDHFVLLDPITRQPVGTIAKNLAEAENQKAIGKAQGEAAASYKSMAAKLPGLEKVVGELDKLADQATYTKAGQWYDAARKEMGLDPREEAVARTKYIAMVDNQILPLLRDTFGAQFTVQEGESLRATLGDPNKTPAEKKEVLNAFIKQKKRDVEALALQSLGSGDASMAAPSGGSGSDYKSKYGLD